MNDEEEMNEEGIAAASNNTTTTANDSMWINIMQTEVTRLSSKVTAHEHNVREMFEHRARDAKTAMDDMVSEMNKRMDDLAARIVVLEDEKAELRRINQRLTEKVRDKDMEKAAVNDIGIKNKDRHLPEVDGSQPMITNDVSYHLVEDACRRSARKLYLLVEEVKLYKPDCKFEDYRHISSTPRINTWDSDYDEEEHERQKQTIKTLLEPLIVKIGDTGLVDIRRLYKACIRCDMSSSASVMRKDCFYDRDVANMM